jgi:hypothetical protein
VQLVWATVVPAVTLDLAALDGVSRFVGY